jgi:lipid-A-disaccharide synthase
LVKPSAARHELRKRYGIPDGTPLVALLPGSRKGEIERHLPILLEAVRQIKLASAPRFTLAVPSGTHLGPNFRERISELSIQVLEGQTWDVLACADLALAASGTVTIEATLLGSPMVTFYRVNKLSWLMGKHLVKVPFYSMVNLVAGRRIVPELIQSDMTAERLAEESMRLIGDEPKRESMRSELALVAQELAGTQDPLEVAAAMVEKHLKEELVHA